MSHFFAVCLLVVLTLVLESCSDPAPPPPVTVTKMPPPEIKKVEPPDPGMLAAKLAGEQKKAAIGEGERSSLRVMGAARDLAIQLALKAKAPVKPTIPTGPRTKKINADKKPANGTIDAKKVGGVFRLRQAQLQTCYERGLKKDPSLRGRVKMTVTIGKSGKVESVRVGGNSLGKPVVGCMKRSIKGWNFPKPAGGRVVVAKTFTFTPQT